MNAAAAGQPGSARIPRGKTVASARRASTVPNMTLIAHAPVDEARAGIPQVTGSDDLIAAGWRSWTCEGAAGTRVLGLTQINRLTRTCCLGRDQLAQRRVPVR